MFSVTFFNLTLPTLNKQIYLDYAYVLIFIQMRKISKNSSLPSMLSVSSHIKSKSKPQIKKQPIKDEKKIEISYVKHLLNEMLLKRKKQAFSILQYLKKNSLSYENNIRKFNSSLQMWQKKLKKQAFTQLTIKKIKEGTKVNSCSLIVNSIRRITQRKKTDFLGLVKNLTIKDMRAQTSTMIKDNQKYKENVFSEPFIKQLRKLTKLNPQTNQTIFSQTIEQNLLPLISQELISIQARRRKKNQGAENQAVLNIMNSLSVCLINTNRNQKLLQEESKLIKESNNSLKDLEGLVEQLQKFDKQFQRKNDTQLKKIIQNQIRVCQKKKATSYLFQSRQSLLQMLNRTLITNQKQNPHKQVVEKFQIFAESFSKPTQLEMFKATLKPNLSHHDRLFIKLSNQLLGYYKGIKHEQSERKQRMILEQVMNLDKILQRVVQGKLFESGKKSGWKNLLKTTNLTMEMEKIYENLGKMFQVLEIKDNRINQFEREVENFERILDNVVRLMNDQYNQQAQKDWQEIQSENTDKMGLFEKINEHFEHVHAIQNDQQHHLLPVHEHKTQTMSEFEKQILYLNRMLQDQEGRIIDLEKENTELKQKEQMLNELQQTVFDEEEMIRDLSNQIDRLRKNNEQKQRKIEEARQQFSKFKYNFKMHEQEFKHRKQQISAIMKSPKHANLSKNTSFLRQQSQVLNQSESEISALKTQNLSLQAELRKLRQFKQTAIAINNAISLIYNIITVGSRIPNESPQAKKLWSLLTQLQAKYTPYGLVEWLISVQNKISDWINGNVVSKLKDKISDQTKQMNQLLFKLHKIGKEDDQTPKKRHVQATLKDILQTQKTQR